MKTRIKFQKIGYVRFIGHLDVQRYFQQAFKRADIPVLYSKGFSPHPILSFASPLGIGMTSEGEYVDVELDETKVTSSEDLENLIEKLNAVMNEGISVLDWKKLDDKAKNAMSMVAASDYMVSFRPGYYPKEVFLQRCEEFFRQEEMIVLKETKRSKKEENIRPLLLELKPMGESIFIKTVSGSANNLKPELVMNAFCNYLGYPYEKIAFMIHRLETYMKAEETYVSLLYPSVEMEAK
ncbi:MAG: TIGR03936 family radical SAM-associated protein [Lachnospiraceae bacterium]